jgi:hypothetical protein
LMMVEVGCEQVPCTGYATKVGRTRVFELEASMASGWLSKEAFVEVGGSHTGKVAAARMHPLDHAVGLQ